MKTRPLGIVSLAALTPLLTGCVILPAMVHGVAEERTVPDKPAYLEAVAIEFDIEDSDLAKDIALEAGESVCRLHDGGMNKEAIITFLDENASDSDLDLDAEVVVDAAFTHLC